MDAKIGLAAAMLVLASVGANAGEPAVFDAATGHLTMPVLQIDQSLRFRDVVIQLVDPGQLSLDDPAVGTEIGFFSAANAIRIPQLSFAGTIYQRVSLSNPVFALVSYGDIVVDSVVPGQYQLDIQVTAAGVTVPPITVANVPKPSNQDEFCNDPGLRSSITQGTAGMQGTWTMTACSFNGTTGKIDMTLSIPMVNMNLPYSATYTYR